MRSAKTTLAMIFALAAGCAHLAGAQTSQFTLPAGTRIDAQLTSTLSSSANQQGDPFTAKIEDPIFVKGVEVVPAGSMLRGHVAFVKPPGRAKGKAEMRLVADSIVTQNGKQYSLNAQLTHNDSANGVKVKGDEGTLQGPGKSKTQSAEETGIGAAAGAGVGAIADGGIGALAGAIHALAKHHKDIVLHPGTELTFVLTSPATESKATKSSAVSTPFVCTSCR